jgi:hypothetical protein
MQETGCFPNAKSRPFEEEIRGRLNGKKNIVSNRLLTFISR